MKRRCVRPEFVRSESGPGCNARRGLEISTGRETAARPFFGYDSAMAQLTYKDAGVDLGLYAEAMDKLPALMRRTHSGRVIELVGGFAGLFRLNDPTAASPRRYKDPVLVSGTDGVGTKIKVAKE